MPEQLLAPPEPNAETSIAGDNADLRDRLVPEDVRKRSGESGRLTVDIRESFPESVAVNIGSLAVHDKRWRNQLVVKDKRGRAT